ncbi:hypothetical protein [Arthrobacter sp. AFG20]|uniref:hypothetical protein n=1 Tax=Arthrobacter sp. AFG20 TaxID=1688671 RepID=UPI000C9E738D|nr:hypothetical protein [Arthrobacter sp. AFG20]PNH85483.1 hypothetical protein CXZ05_03990 [Arthrobacter sp. AFG20]
MHTDFRDLYEPLPPWGATVDAPFGEPTTVMVDDSELHQQVLDIIHNVLATADPRSEVRRRLLRHLAENPGHPEQALLDHLRDRNRRGGRPARNGRAATVDPHV